MTSDRDALAAIIVPGIEDAVERACDFIEGTEPYDEAVRYAALQAADAIRARYTLDPINADHRWREVDGGPGMLGSRQCTDCGLWYGRWLGDGCPKRGFAVDEPAS
jgi:hypothetical protein